MGCLFLEAAQNPLRINNKVPGFNEIAVSLKKNRNG
jgi:hypothetical protein